MNQTLADQIQNGGIVVGDWVKVKMPDGNIREFTLVTPQEVDPAQGKISNESPIGKALLGGKAGETRTYYVEQQQCEITILEVKKQ